MCHPSAGDEVPWGERQTGQEGKGSARGETGKDMVATTTIPEDNMSGPPRRIQVPDSLSPSVQILPFAVSVDTAPHTSFLL